MQTRDGVVQQDSLVLYGNADTPLCQHEHLSLCPAHFTHPATHPHGQRSPWSLVPRRLGQPQPERSGA